MAQQSPKTRLLSFRWTEEENVRLRQMADAAGIGPTELARDAVRGLLAGRRASAYRRGRDGMTRSLAELHVAIIRLSDDVRCRPDLQSVELREAINDLVAAALRLSDRPDRGGEM